MEGYLEIQRGAFSRSQVNYFRLNGPILMFGPIKAQINNRIHLGIAQLIACPAHPSKFMIHTGMQTLTLRAKNVQQRFIWFRTLQRAQKNFQEAQYLKSDVDKNTNLRELQKLNVSLWQNHAKFESAIQQISINIAKPSKLKSLTQKLRNDALVIKQLNYEVLKLMQNQLASVRQGKKYFQDKPFLGIDKKDQEESSSSQQQLGRSNTILIKNNRNTAKFNDFPDHILESAAPIPQLDSSNKITHTNIVQASLQTNSNVNKKNSITDTENVYQSIDNEKYQSNFFTLKQKYLKSNPIVQKFASNLDHQTWRNGLAEKFIPEQKFPLFSVIKDSGAEMSYPVSVNEPLSFLQRMCEHMYYSNLLELANIQNDQAMRMAYIAAFLVSQYSISELRTKKPFNPLLGETFEFIDEKRNFQFLSEQISHSPPISAIHCQSKDFTYLDNWKYKTNFSGNAIKLVPESLGRIMLNAQRDEYVFSKCTTVLNNVMMGKVSVENIGEITIICQKLRTKAVLKFKENGFFGKKQKNLIQGEVYVNDKLVYNLRGKWNHNLQVQSLKEKNKQITLWEKCHFPNPEYYYFNEYTLQMNHLNTYKYEILPPTDSRFRPDIRALQYREMQTAIREKKRLEEKQRVRQGKLHEEGKKFSSLWFTKVVTENGEQLYVSNEKYWNERRKGSWQNSPDIF